MKKKDKKHVKKTLFDAIDKVAGSSDAYCTATEKLCAISEAVRVARKL